MVPPASTALARQPTPGPAEREHGRVMEWFSVGTGVAILLVLLADVFLTVLHAMGRGGPTTQRVNRAAWWGFRTLGALLSDRHRDRLLAFAGPTIVALALTQWLLLLIVGFAMIYLPWIDTFLASPGELGAEWVAALYYSGYSASTLGVGDLVTDSEALRLITIVEAVSGFILLTAGITYLLAVYAQLTARYALASFVAAFLRDGAAEMGRAVERSGEEALTNWMNMVTPQLLVAMQAHHLYPVLHFFRPADPTRSLDVQMGRLIELWREVRTSAPGSRMGAVADHPAAAALFTALDRYLTEVDHTFLPISPADVPADRLDRVAAAHRRVIGHLGYASPLDPGP